jgi:acyl-CoA thioesterase-1
LSTQVEMTEKLKEIWLDYVINFDMSFQMLPKKFILSMKHNTGMVANNTVYGLDENGLERRNPLIVSIGDSVTAGHFEWNINHQQTLLFMQGKLKEDDSTKLEIVDLLSVYHEQFKRMLSELFPSSSVSVVNAGIAGDNASSIYKRLQRDAIDLHPDLIIWNAAINWNNSLGNLDSFREIVLRTTDKILESQTDLILMTPNGVFAEDETKVELQKRVEVIKQIAYRKEVCLVDFFYIWQSFIKKNDIDEACMLANHINHPTAAGHTGYAVSLMKAVLQAYGVVDDKKWLMKYLHMDNSY